MKSTTGKKISDLINEPWRDVGLDAMKRGMEICKRNELIPDANTALCFGLCDIIMEIKDNKKETQ
jgi:hypothetical protein